MYFVVATTTHTRLSACTGGSHNHGGFFMYSHGAFGGPHPQLALPPACGAPALPDLTPPTFPTPDIRTSAKCAKHNVLRVGRNACRTRVGDRHLRAMGTEGCLGRFRLSCFDSNEL